MGVAQVKNNAYSKVVGSLSSAATSLTVTAGQGARFPTISVGSGDFFYLTLIDLSNNIEVVKVTARSTDTMTIVRGQDGTTARAFSSNDRVELRPTAGLFDDKMSKGGGVFTGAIEVPASATGSQAPRVSEVVKKAGDQMSGPLILPELRGSSNEILIPTGHRIKGQTPGTITQPGMVINTEYYQIDDIVTWSTAAATTIELDVFTKTFTPKYNNSKVLLAYDIVAESGHNMVFRLTRNGNNIGNNSTVPLQTWVGWKTGMYDGDTASTPRHFHMTYMDAPATTSPCEYKLLIIPSDASTLTFQLNRPINGAAVGQSGYEVATSSVMFQEIAQ